MRRGGDWRTIKGNFGPPGEMMDLAGMTHMPISTRCWPTPVDLIDICLPTAPCPRGDQGPGGRQARALRKADRLEAG